MTCPRCQQDAPLDAAWVSVVAGKATTAADEWQGSSEVAPDAITAVREAIGGNPEVRALAKSGVGSDCWATEETARSRSVRALAVKGTVPG